MITIAVAASLLTQNSDYHGFVRHDFQSAGTSAIVVEPKRVAAGRPWIWRTEFFDHRPELDLMMLKKGYHLVHLSVGNTFGAPAAMEQFGTFYKELVGSKWKLNRRVVLEGFSRGGLYAYNWAARNPDKVQAIYGDAPVCDFKSWPRQHSPEDWNALIACYGFPNQFAAIRYSFNPIDNLLPLAQAKIPLIHVVGDADTVVPIAENTTKLEQKYKLLGGTIEVIHKPGLDHHPHSLDDPSPIAKFLEAHASDSAKSPPAPCVPAPNPESRYSSAGWGERSWLDQHRDILAEGSRVKYDLVLVGDSITQGFGGPGRRVYGGGADAYNELLGGCLNAGISGDRVQNVAWRLENGLSNVNTRLFLVLIGINNAGDDSPSAVAAGLRQIKRRFPNTKIVPILPAGFEPNGSRRQWVNTVNADIRSFAEPPISGMLLSNGNLNPDLYAGDGLHLSAAGYEVLAKAIARRYVSGSPTPIVKE
ncbi:MAG: GDSL-type esterase/lipase family protein [Fimbriimonadaceae bacterium]